MNLVSQNRFLCYFLFISTPKIFASRRRRAFGELITTIFIVPLLLLSVYDLGVAAVNHISLTRITITDMSSLVMRFFFASFRILSV